MDFQLRQATPDDAEAVVRMHTLAHEECYRHLLSPEFFRARRASVPERVERRRPHLDVQVLPGLDHLGAMNSSVVLPILTGWLRRVGWVSG